MQRTVRRHEFVNDVEPEAFGPNMSKVDGSMRVRTNVTKQKRVNVVGPDWAVESNMTSLSGNIDIRSLGISMRETVNSGESVSDVEPKRIVE